MPNVAELFGTLLHEGKLIIPRGMAVHATGFEPVPTGGVLAAKHTENALEQGRVLRPSLYLLPSGVRFSGRSC